MRQVARNAFRYIHAYLTERRYSAHSVSSYQASVSHFACWMKRNRLATKQIDEALVARFLDHHLPRCNCAGLIRRTYTDVRAALGHLLIVLRASAEIAPNVHNQIRRWTTNCAASTSI